MSKTTQTKPLVAYKELDEPGRRLVNKLIISLHYKHLDESCTLNINRCINRARRDPSDTGKRYTNGYLVFYKQKFAQLRMNEKDKPVTETAKQLGALWKSLSEEDKAVFNKQAADQR
jgi:hypothetical protein